MFSDNYYSEKEPSEKIAFPFLFISRYVLSLNLNKSFTTRKVKNGSFNKINLHIQKTLFLLYFPPPGDLYMFGMEHTPPCIKFHQQKKPARITRSVQAFGGYNRYDLDLCYQPGF